MWLVDFASRRKAAVGIDAIFADKRQNGKSTFVLGDPSISRVAKPSGSQGVCGLSRIDRQPAEFLGSETLR